MINLDPPTPLAEYRADLPPNLIAVIHQCLEKDKARRWPNVAALAAALAPHGSAASAGYAERVAKVQQIDVVPSRPTMELRAPSSESLVEAASASPAMLASAPHPETRAIIQAAPRPPSSGRPLGQIVGAVAGALLVVTVPIAVYFGLQARERVDRLAVPAASDATATATPPVSVTTTAAPTAEPSKAPPEVASAAPSASSMPIPRGRSSAPASPRAPATARPSSGVLGGARR